MKNALIAALVAALVATTLSGAADFQPTPIAKPNPAIRALQHRLDRLQNLEARHTRSFGKRLTNVEASTDLAYKLADYGAWATDCITGAQWITDNGENAITYTDESSADDNSTLVATLDPKCLTTDDPE